MNTMICVASTQIVNVDLFISHHQNTRENDEEAYQQDHLSTKQKFKKKCLMFQILPQI